MGLEPVELKIKVLKAVRSGMAIAHQSYACKITKSLLDVVRINCSWPCSHYFVLEQATGEKIALWDMCNRCIMGKNLLTVFFSRLVFNSN